MLDFQISLLLFYYKPIESYTKGIPLIPAYRQAGYPSPRLGRGESGRTMDNKLKLRFAVRTIIFIFLIISCPSLFSFANNNERSTPSTNLNPFIKGFIAR